MDLDFGRTNKRVPNSAVQRYNRGPRKQDQEYENIIHCSLEPTSAFTASASASTATTNSFMVPARRTRERKIWVYTPRNELSTRCTKTNSEPTNKPQIEVSSGVWCLRVVQCAHWTCGGSRLRSIRIWSPEVHHVYVCGAR